MIKVGGKGELSTSMPHHPLTMDPVEFGGAVYMTKEMVLTCRGTPEVARARKASRELNVLAYLVPPSLLSPIIVNSSK